MTNLQKMYPISIAPVLNISNILEGIRNNSSTSEAIFGAPIPEGSLEVPPHTTFIHIIQIGAGGTGGYVASEIMRFLGNIPKPLQDMFFYTLCDGDSFEPKNLGRQLCTEEDLGMNKAEALVSAYGPHFGCKMNNIQIIPQYLTSISDLYKINAGLLKVKSGSPQSDVGILLGTNQRVLRRTVKCHHQFPPLFVNSYRVWENNITIIPIIIDCVDKTTPRHILHTYLEDIQTKDAFPMIYNISLKLLTGWKKYRAKISNNGCDVIATPHGDIVLASKGEVIATFGYTSGVVSHQPQTYIISSGNGHFTGQVYWGRCSTIKNKDTNPISYKDIYGDKDVSHLFNATTIEEVTNEINDEGNEILLGTLEVESDTYAKFNMVSEDPAVLAGIERRLTRFAAMRKYMRDIMTAENTTNDPIVNLKHKTSRVFDAMTGKIDSDISPIQDFDKFASSIISVPSPYKIHPELIDLEIDKQEEQMSCAERAATNVQNINANKTAATLVMNYLTGIINGLLPMEPGSTLPISTAGVKFDVRTNSFTPELITTDYLKQV